MIKEAKNIDLYTTGRQPSEEEYSCIGEWVKNTADIGYDSVKKMLYVPTFLGKTVAACKLQ
jgi:hypothetical protein